MLRENKIWLGTSPEGPVTMLPQLANRHGLISGATGTGKTVTLQVMAEAFSQLSVPVFLADVKGDLAGLAKPGEMNDRIRQRMQTVGLENFAPHASPVLVNLASTEYFKATEAKTLRHRVITPVFKEERNGTARTIGLMAKRARGMMARFLVTQRLEEPEGLKDFTAGGYRFQPKQSSAETWVFTRPHP